jgi:hypothetical protein
MKPTYLSILQHLYHQTSNGGFLSLYQLEIAFGLSGGQLQAVLEDLKEEELVVESPSGFQISRKGILFGRTRWV